MTTVSAGMRWKMRKAGAFCALDTASKFAPRPLIVMFLVITSSAVVSVTVCPLSAASKLIMSPLFASTSACRNEPGPLSLVLMTVMVAAFAGIATAQSRLTHMAARCVFTALIGPILE
ncbi:MAG: hypothetical protein DME80_02550 [Verrucomicrobia bacterium]|nr:MAG: hypothetical protein DME89_02570 [Verrucomicrobiota bacterium]PYJ45487.1 MAG: hypothetical protein DME80_02550 [Verrucomicrobiota bacterium]PYL54224.1 MAG: hypothetical protein DMF33_02105 [Verrucomicrobiota bacterium]